MKISEIFLSIQGEGVSIGLPTIFIRTTGCNLRCSWCDTKYAYDKGKEKTISDIINKCKTFGFKRVSITGGEPLFQKSECIELIEKLSKDNYEILLETNGSLDIQSVPKNVLISLDIKCPSSGMSENMLYKNIDYIRKTDQIKFIIENKKDYDFAKKIILDYKLNKKTNLIFMPVWGTKFSKIIIKNILKDKLDIRFSLQAHKIIWGDKKGV